MQWFFSKQFKGATHTWSYHPIFVRDSKKCETSHFLGEENMKVGCADRNFAADGLLCTNRGHCVTWRLFRWAREVSELRVRTPRCFCWKNLTFFIKCDNFSVRWLLEKVLNKVVDAIHLVARNAYNKPGSHLWDAWKIRKRVQWIGTSHFLVFFAPTGHENQRIITKNI